MFVRRYAVAIHDVRLSSWRSFPIAPYDDTTYADQLVLAFTPVSAVSYDSIVQRRKKYLPFTTA